ncbi:hypothetical protein MTR67_036143 [Solanum verrucosum]|uniref:Uncharacterized protein n=1 Tax=Solanum verrucosum TaxID=315347 RepID=A0AAF0UB59_SOLVR|nr:uncharacterized protein LOC125838837 [Solanum verrucosum]WMV42758.1 hypothetical protein MTR67_036143 [Solanum verrucosum]
MNFLKVVVQVENRGKSDVYLKESFLHALPGRYGLVIRIAPFSTKVIAAHTFFARNKSFGRPSTVEVHINGKFIQRLTPQTFVHFPKIIVDDGFTDGEGSIIRVIHPQRPLELSRLRAFNFLAMGFKERKEVWIVKK